MSRTGLSRIQRELFSEFSTKKQGDNFVQCGDCDDLKQMRSACTRDSGAYDVCQKRLDMHITGQRAHRKLYYANRFLSEKEPERCVTIIHDKMDHSKTSSPHFSHKKKAYGFLHEVANLCHGNDCPWPWRHPLCSLWT